MDNQERRATLTFLSYVSTIESAIVGALAVYSAVPEFHEACVSHPMPLYVQTCVYGVFSGRFARNALMAHKFSKEVEAGL